MVPFEDTVGYIKSDLEHSGDGNNLSCSFEFEGFINTTQPGLAPPPPTATNYLTINGDRILIEGNPLVYTV